MRKHSFTLNSIMTYVMTAMSRRLRFRQVSGRGFFVANAYQSKILSILISSTITTLSLITVRSLNDIMTSQQVTFLSIFTYVINIYLIYQIFDLIQIKVTYLPRTRMQKFSSEFLKIIVAFFIATIIDYYFIKQPVFNLNLDPDYLFILIAVSIPSAVIARIISEIRQVKNEGDLFMTKENQNKLLVILLSSTIATLSLVIVHALKDTMTSQAVNFLSIVIYVIDIYLFYQIFDFAQSNLSYRPRTRTQKFLSEFLKIVAAFFIAGVMDYYFIKQPIFNLNFDPNYLFILVVVSIPSAVIARIISELRQVKEVALQSRLAQAEAQYNLLEMQMQPHFLFNSLNVLSELIYVDPDLACSMTQKLADLYRDILTNSKRKFSNLESEISILEKYIDIQKIRFEDRIRFTIDVKRSYMDLYVPSLILQTLVENAIKHGISPRQEGGEIRLSVVPKDYQYEICISNTGEMQTKKRFTKRGQGTGLQNTKNRLDLIYGSSHNFRIYSEDGYTYVRFNVSPDVAHSPEVSP